MKKYLLAMFAWVIIFSVPTFAQQTFRVGDEVEAQRGSTWYQGQIESINGSIIKVRFGPGKYDFQNYQGWAQIKARGTAANQMRNQETWNAFRSETLDKYFRDVQMLAPYYDEKFNSAGGHNTMVAWQEMTTRLSELDSICRTKYANITDDPTYMRAGDFDYHYADWCKIAARRDEFVKLARIGTAAHMASVPGADDLKRALENDDNRVVDDIQLLMYEPDKWKTLHLGKLKPHFANYGVEMPANFFDDMLKKAAELKAKIDAGAPLREFETSATRDAAVESFIKGKFIAEYPGSQILKSRVDYPNWVKRESLSLVGSGTGYKLYKVEYNFYKRGWVLMKMPNRPFCQAREWVVGRGAKGLVAVSTSSQGTFMKCQ